MIKAKKHKNILEICKEIDLIIEKKDNKSNYKDLHLDMLITLNNEFNYSEIVTYCSTVLKIATTKNRILRYLEKDFWFFINELPFKILNEQDFEIVEDEEIAPDIDYENQWKRILSRILGLSIEILKLPDDNSNGSELRRANALKLIAELNNYYIVPDAKIIFMNSIKSKNRSEQLYALEGLENYYNLSEETIDEDLLNTLNEIYDEADDRVIASTCLQIQINAGIIDELTAVFEMDDWKDEHY